MSELEDTMLQKKCTGPCGQEYPATTEYWHRCKKSKDGLRNRCKECRSKETKAYNSRYEIQERQKAYRSLPKMHNYQHDENEALMKRCGGPCGKEYPATTKYWHRDKGLKDGLESRCKECKNKADKARRSRPEVQERNKFYGKAYRSRPEVQEQRKAWRKAHYNRPEVQERRSVRMKAYYSRPEIQEQRKAWREVYRSRPEVQEHQKVYRSRPEVQERRNAYFSRPEVQERRKVYRNRPEIKKHRKIQDKVYYRLHPEIKERVKAYHSRPEVQERVKAYYSRPEVQERVKVYQSRPETKERHRIHGITRRARKRAVKGTHTPQQINEQLKRQKHKCYYCQKRLQKAKGKYIYHIDHTFPLSRVVGTDIPANDISYLVLTCPTCNLSKGNKFPWEFGEGGRLC